jgi:drug/metabolite transporter (DMT)-like permease
MPGAPAPAVSALRYTALALTFCLLWTGAFIAVKVGLRSSPPLFLMASRFLVAGAALLVVARFAGRPLPPRLADWGPIALLGLLNNALYLGITSLGLREISAGMGAVLASTNPLMLALVAPWFLGERLTARRVAGLLVSFGGVVVVMASRIGPQNRPVGMALVLLSITFLVAGTLVFKRLRPEHDIVVINGGQLLVAGVALAGPSLLWEPLAEVRLTASFLGAQAFLIGGVSWVGMSIWFWLLRNGDATRASAWFFLNPVLGLFLGALLLAEPLRVEDFLGSAAVALGIYIVQRS